MTLKITVPPKSLRELQEKNKVDKNNTSLFEYNKIYEEKEWFI